MEVEPELGCIEADAAKLSDVLTNLLANAIKFTRDQGTIRIQARMLEGKSDWVRVAVEDEGGGVPASDQPYLFQPFFTGFDTLHHSSGDYQFGKRGIGLGLCLVKTFVELHGGRVEVESAPDRGSTFAFVLPRRQSAGEVQEPPEIRQPDLSDGSPAAVKAANGQSAPRAMPQEGLL
jgi:signal transduction histidine kinase